MTKMSRHRIDVKMRREETLRGPLGVRASVLERVSFGPVGSVAGRGAAVVVVVEVVMVTEVPCQ
ncbi:hypothetical protein [Streptomyces sp. KLOTTS4A1]|uniref:hypothetical protein n=1 Tax=Streptomyces sp. KLOTTS4A1 TaxID=3390996 RepID=UPI0039F4AA9B